MNKFSVIIPKKWSSYKVFFLVIINYLLICSTYGQGTRLLRQPSISDAHITFTYGGDVWVSERDGTNVLRITSTPAVEKNPFLSPDGESIAFTSNRSGTDAVYLVSRKGGSPQRLTWHPSAAIVRGWSKNGSKILYASSREYAPKPSNRLWMVSTSGGNSELLTFQRSNNGSFSPDQSKIVIEQVSRWDVEWRNYRGGQNKPLIILNLQDLSEVLIPNERTTDLNPIWIGSTIYFLSDRNGPMNIWSYAVESGDLKQITNYTGSDIKWLSGKQNLTFERDGYLFLLDPSTNVITQLEVNISGDFPWAETKWENVNKQITSASLSASGKRIIMEARGEIFTIPVEYGDTRNITSSSGAADRRPIWSPKGDKIAWFSDDNQKEYVLKLVAQDGMSIPEEISMGESKMAWEPVWSPDGKYIAFVDDDLQVRVVDLGAKTIRTIGLGGVNFERGSMGLSWSPDSKWLAYSKSGTNNFRSIMVWSLTNSQTRPITNAFADAFSPTWDLDCKHMYFLASTDVALGSMGANTSSMNARPEYVAYVINLDKSDSSPFKLRSDEEEVNESKEELEKDKKKEKTKDTPEKEETKVILDFEQIERRTIPLPIPARNYRFIEIGTEGTVFIAERLPNQEDLTIHKFELSERKMTEYLSGVKSISVSADGKKLLAQINDSWKVMDTDKPSEKAKSVKVNLQVKLDRIAEWSQIFQEAWRYERDYFYDPNMHGRDWDVVYERYAPLVPFIKHRTDLTYVLDQVNGELSVGHSFVRGGDYPKVEEPRVGLLGVDLRVANGRWRIDRIYTTENWNPELTSPLDQPGLNVREGNYLVGINGVEFSSADNPFQILDGTVGKQTVLHVNNSPDYNSAWTIIVKPIRSDNALRQRAWVEDNRRKVDSLSNGLLAYVWVPNTGNQGLVSFNRYFFAQQDKKGAVIDERFNGGGQLDDYMVDLMTRSLRAAITNEVPNGAPLRLPAGILGPKVLLINEMAGSGGDFFPWVFRQQKAGLLIGARTWGGGVKNSVHYRLIDGGTLTAPDNAIFDPVKKVWIAENVGVVPDIEVQQDTKSLTEGRDPQLERAVKELLKQIKESSIVSAPAFPTPAKNKE